MLIVKKNHTEEIGRIKEEINRRFNSIYLGISSKDLNLKATQEKFKSNHFQFIIEENSLFASFIFTKLGLVDPKRFGIMHAKRFWYFVYSADQTRYTTFRKRYLLELQKELPLGSALLPLYALLYDKLAISSGKKQRYGTQKVKNYEESIINFDGLKDRLLAMGLK